MVAGKTSRGRTLSFPGRVSVICSSPEKVLPVKAYSTLTFLNRSEFVTTNTLEKAIAPAASIGLSSPAAAAGMSSTL